MSIVFIQFIKYKTINDIINYLNNGKCSKNMLNLILDHTVILIDGSKNDYIKKNYIYLTLKTIFKKKLFMFINFDTKLFKYTINQYYPFIDNKNMFNILIENLSKMRLNYRLSTMEECSNCSEFHRKALFLDFIKIDDYDLIDEISSELDKESKFRYKKFIIFLMVIKKIKLSLPLDIIKHIYEFIY